MHARSATLRSKLLRWLLIPLLLLFLDDAIGSYFMAKRLSDRVYDGELMEIARELNLHVRPNGTVPAFDLEKDAERTLLLDQYDTVYYAVHTVGGAWIAGDAELPPHGRSQPTDFRDDHLRGQPVRIAQLRSSDNGMASVVVQVAETRVKRHRLANEILIGVILPQLLLIAIAGAVLWGGVARGLAPLRHLQQAVAARSHLDLSPVAVEHVPGEVEPLLSAINDLMKRLDAI
jgi:two-component system sensor histidine kinase TctE